MPVESAAGSNVLNVTTTQKAFAASMSYFDMSNVLTILEKLAGFA